MAIPLTCPSCDYEFKVKDELAGRKIRCPKCKAVIAVLAQEEETVAQTVAKKKVPAVDEPDEDEEEEEERPRKKKKKKAKNNRGLLIGAGIGSVVLIVVVILIIMLAGGGNAGTKQVVQQPAQKAPVIPAKQVPDEEPEIVKKAAVGGIARSRERTEIENNLKQLALAYRNFEVTNNRGPKDQKELAPYYENSMPINEALKNKWITFIWGVNNRSGFPDGTSNTILAYETDPDRQGNRFVVMGDVSVHTLDEATFQRTPKAKGK